MPKFDYSDLIGKPFAAGGRGPDAYDCRGLVVEVFRRMGIDIPEKMAAIEQNALECSESRVLIHKRIAEESPKWTRVERPEPGDLVTIMIRPPYVSHLGVVVGGGRFIHIMNKTQVVIERLSDPVWKKRIAGFYRWPINGNGDGE